MISMQTKGIENWRRAKQDYERSFSTEIITEFKRQARLFVEDCIYMTPPFPADSPIAVAGGRKGNLNRHRRVGEAAVDADIRKVFTPIEEKGKRDAALETSRANFATADIHFSDAKKNEKLHRTLDKYKAAGDSEKIKTIFKRVTKRDHVIYSTVELHRDEHKRLRDRRGRVRRNRRTIYIADSASIPKYIREIQRRVGIAKAGWLLAFSSLGGSAPGWITRHAGKAGGLFATKLSGNDPWIKVGNNVPYIQEAGRELRIIARATANRQRNMQIELQKKQQYRARKFNRH